MSSPSPTPQDSNVIAGDIAYSAGKLIEWGKRHSTPYHLVVASVIGGVTAFFAVVIALLIIVALNFNVLGWVE